MFWWIRRTFQNFPWNIQFFRKNNEKWKYKSYVANISYNNYFVKSQRESACSTISVIWCRESVDITRVMKWSGRTTGIIFWTIQTLPTFRAEQIKVLRTLIVFIADFIVCIPKFRGLQVPSFPDSQKSRILDFPVPGNPITWLWPALTGLAKGRVSSYPANG